jgi:site-specific DNA-methyltransferase (adenine-specific)
MEGMKQFPDKYFELAIVDPPYGININHNMCRRKGDKHSNYKKVDWDSLPPNDDYFKELFRVSKNQIVWGANYFNLPPTKFFIVWDKPQMSADVSFSMCEYAWGSFNETSKTIRNYMSDSNRIHPTQKPIALYKWILSRYAKHGDKILDTHVGSASSLIACYQMGFDYIGFEIDKEYFEKAQKRIEQEKAQISLFYGGD